MGAKIQVAALAEDKDYRLELELITGARGLTREIAVPRIQKPGLALSGYLDQVKPDRVQILGQTELAYLETMPEAVAKERARALLARGICCAVVTTGRTPPAYLVSLAAELDIPLFVTRLLSSVFISRVSAFLQAALAERTSIHGVLLDVNGVGILILGKSGIGKSECALDLVIRGHRLVADDIVEIARTEDTLVGRASPMIKHLMEVRGLGIINIKDLFGIASVREVKRVELVAELCEWNPEEEYDRLGIDDPTYEILGIEVPYHLLPVRPGRNMTSIIEIAARNHLLKIQGHHSAREFQRRLSEELAQARPLRPLRGKAE
jgi:HPr kinase/phosphorylase